MVNIIALRMKEIREQHNHTQEFLIENTGLHLSHYEHGRKLPTVSSIAKFCKFYDLSLEEFFSGISYPQKK